VAYQDDGEDLLDKSVIIALDGQKVAGRVTAVHASTLEVTLTLRQPATGYVGTTGSTTLPDGEQVTFDLGRHSYYTQLVVEIPRARKAERRAQTVEVGAEVPEDERRRFFRFPTDCDVEALEELPNGRDYVRARGKTLNLSGGGMLVQLDKPLLPGHYTWRVYLPNETILLPGAVIRAKKGPSLVMPVEFVGLHEVERSKLIRFIFQRMRNLKDEVANKKKDKEEPRYWRRKEKYMTPPRPRYW
jgi:hypothetical protein